MRPRELATFSQDAHSVIVAEMVKGERTEHHVVRFRRTPFEQVGANEIDLRISGTQSSRNCDGGFLLIDRVDVNGNILVSRMIGDQLWDVARSRGNVQDSRFPVWLKPASQKMPDHSVAAEPAIKRAQIGKVTF